MDEKNGEVFDHHAELFAQIGNVTENESLRDFLISPTGMIDHNSTAKNFSVPSAQIGSTSHDNMWSHGYGCNQPSGLLLNHTRTGFNLPLSVSQLDMPSSVIENSNILLDNLVKNIPLSSNTLNPYASASVPNKSVNIDCRTVTDNSNLLPSTLFSGMCGNNSEKVTQDFLGNYNKLESSDMIVKCSEYENVAWNGIVCDSINNINFHSQNRLSHSFQSSIDKNGNSALFGSTHDKISCGSNSSEHFIQNNFMTRLSPSASVETSVRTPATSYESASPLSSNRTPIRSDESISPMGSGHTPLRVEDSTSPLTNIKTPLRIEEGSPLGRTPLRVEESYSPMGSSSNNLLTSNSPSHKINGPVQGSETYQNPPCSLKKIEAKSPSSNLHQTKPKIENPESMIDSPETSKLIEESMCSPKKSDEKLDLNLTGSTKSDASSVKEIIRQFSIPFSAEKRVDDSLNSKKSVKRTLSDKSDCEFYLTSSSAIEKEGSDLKTLPRINEACSVKTEFLNVPEVETNKLNVDAQNISQMDRVSFGEEFFSKSKRRRKKSDNNSNLPNAKRRNRKRVTIYQSLMSPEETGIKLKIKVASAFQRVKPQKKRRSKRQFCSDDEEDGKSKRCKKVVRFSNHSKESEGEEQTEWGNKLPPNILQKIFHYVVEDQGCVPSLVR